MYFGNRHPRGFRHTFRFTDERREVLDKLRQGIAPETIARQSISSGDYAPQRRRTGGYGAAAAWSGRMAVAVLVILLAVLLTLLA